MIPPPPVALPPTISEQRKRRKRFQLPHLLEQQQLPPSNSSSKLPPPITVPDFQLQPFIHYGLNRNLTTFAVMDKDNILTHGPTLVSFGGSSFELGYQSTLLILELDPATKYSQDGGLDTSFEFEWKPVKTENSDIFQDESFSCLFGSIMYSKENQSIYVFGSNWVNSWIPCLNLRTLRWEKKKIKINQEFILTKFALRFDEERFLLYTQPNYFTACNFALFSFTELDRIFQPPQQKSQQPQQGNDVVPNLQSLSEPFSPIPTNSSGYDLGNTIYQRMVCPIPEQNKLLIFGDAYSEGSVFTLDCQTNNHHDSKKREKVLIESEATNRRAIELEDEFNSKFALLATEMNFYKYNIRDQTFRTMTYSKPAIELKYHKLFPPFIANFKNRKNENMIIHIPNNDILFMMKLDFNKPFHAFNKLLSNQAHYSDVSIKLYH